MSAGAMPTRQMLAYGALGFPLAFAALPLYVHVPKLYADSVGLPLALVGAVLLLTRFADALIDPLLGQWSDRLGNRRRLIAFALPLLGLGLATLLAPPADGGVSGLAWLVLSLSLTFIGFSLATINYHAWGAEIGETPQERVGVTAAREMFALAGVVVAAALPSLLAKDVATAMQHLGWVFIPVLALAALATFAGAPAATPSRDATPGLPLSAVFADPRFRRLLAVLATGGIASAIPATLVLFFIADVLQLPEWQGLFLVIYFVCGGLALPGWVALARRYGKVRTWLASMVLAIASFVWAFLLDAGDGFAFALICAASGAALGAELALPPALLADLLADGRRKGRAAAGAGAYFGVWNFVNKFNLALAAGIALPLVALFGYKVGAGDTASQGLLALAATYALLPAAIKVVSLLLLWRWRHHFEGRTS
ncbi:MAG: MFS transporter [Sulfuritalea sp.]|nr:MFS transporter [Sulfuritalea sp.]